MALRIIGVAALILAAAAAGVRCGGRTQLVPAYQVGRLSEDAVMADHAGVRAVVRTAAWPGPPLDAMLPVEVTFANDSSRTLQIRRQHIALSTAHGETLATLDPTALDSMRRRALVEGTLGPDERLTGFVYFVEPQAEDLNLRIDLVSSPTGERFGEMVIPFVLD